MPQYAQPPPCPTVTVDELDQVCGGNMVTDAAGSVVDWTKQQGREAWDQVKNMHWSKQGAGDGAQEGGGFGLLGGLSFHNKKFGFNTRRATGWGIGLALAGAVIQGFTADSGRKR